LRMKILLLKGYEIEAVDHEMGHSVAHRVFGTTRPKKYRKYLSGEYAEDIEGYVSDLALEHEGEVFAWGFEFMRKKPSVARRLMRKNPRLKELFSEIIKDTGYDFVLNSRGRR